MATKTQHKVDTYAEHAGREPHPWVSKTGKPYSARIRDASCRDCGCTPDCPAHNR